MNSIKRVAISQSSYIPWKGFFDLINNVDHFVLYDDVQYTKRDWRNRNRIKSAQGNRWLSIPVKVKNRSTQRLCDTEIADMNWGRHHWKAISHSYARSPYFKEFAKFFEEIYLGTLPTKLSEVNYLFIQAVCNLLAIKTPISFSMEMHFQKSDKNRQLLSLCQELGATDYFSGPSAESYIDVSLIVSEGIRIHVVDYADYPEYPQLFPPFNHHVSILDLIFCTGPRSRSFMKSFR